MFNARWMIVPAGIAVLLLSACNTAPRNRGTAGGRMDPASDAPSERGSLSLRSQDLVTATDKMAQSIAQRPDIVNPQNRPIFFVGPVINETSQPNQNFQIFANRLRAVLTSSGSRHGLDVRQNRDFVERMRALEYGTTADPDTGRAYASENEYVLTAIVQDLPNFGTNYYLIEYQLVQLKDFAQSGPSIGPGAIVWSDFYEVKFN